MNFTTTVLCSLLFCAGTVRAQESGSFQRLLKLEGTLNTRDIGGYRTADGREVVRNKLFRSSELSYLTDEDMHVLQEKRISSVVDFRGDKETANAPDRLPLGVRRVASPIIGDQLDKDEIQRFLKKDGFGKGMYDEAMVSSYGPFYRMLTLVNTYDDPKYVDRLAGYKPFFSELLHHSDNSAILFHCTGGRDRTGVGTALLLSILGVPAETIEDDYLASNVLLRPDQDDANSLAFEKFRFSSVYLQPISNRKFQQVARLLGETPEKISSSILLKREYLRSLFSNIRRKYGSVEQFAGAKLGLDPADIEKLRKKYLKPV